MKSFKDHLDEEILLEKVSQKEYKEAENDTNIMIGIEFEVVDSELTASGRSGYDMEEVESDYDDYVSSIVDYADEICDSRDEYYEEIESDKRKRLNQIENERDNIQDKIDTLEKEIDETNEKIARTDDDSELEELQEILDAQEEELEELQSELQNAEDEWERVDDMYGEEYGEEFGLGEWDGPNPPYFTAGKYDDWLDEIGERLPDNSDVVSWCFEKTEYGSDRIGSYEVTSDLLEYLPFPSEDFYGDSGEFDVDGDAYNDLVRKVTKGKEPEVGGYHASSNYKKWRIEEDSSLNSGGAEIISPILTLKDGMKAIENMFDWIDEYANTDSSCGFHINMSFDGYDMTKFDWLKLLFFVEEGAIYKNFSDRANNGYARPIREYLTGVESNPDSIGSKEYFNALSKAQAEGFNAVKKKIGAGKFFGVNFSSIVNGSKNGRIEFRYMGGKYHKKLKEVKKQILQYAAWMKIALDPKYKRNEYLKKLAKFAQGAQERAKSIDNMLSQKFIGTSHGISGEQVWDLYFDESKKLIVILGAGNKPIKALKLVQALKDTRIKKFLLLEGIIIKDLIKGKLNKSQTYSKKYMDEWKKANPDGRISKKEADDFILKYKQ